jgi:alpha-L-rhamnosidase
MLCRFHCFLLVTCAFWLSPALLHAADPQGIRPVELLTQHAIRPLAVETDTPELAWKLVAAPGQRNKMQSAYEIFVAAEAHEMTRHVHGSWNSGKVLSSAISAQYRGPALKDLHTYFWSVRVWDEAGHESAWSAPASFTVGPRQAADWDGARWIAGRPWATAPGTPAPPAPELRRAFTLHKRILNARLDVTGLGYYVLRLDGKPLDDRVLAPGWTSYNKRVLYDSYDVTDRLAAGDHAFGVVLGRGFYANAGPVVSFLDCGDYSARDPKLLLRLRVTYADGSHESIVSDGSWRTHDGPTVANYAYQGETYDARLETTGWSSPHFHDHSWTPAAIVDPPGGRLAADILDPIRAVQVINATGVVEIRPGVWRFEFPDVRAGWALLHLHGAAGNKVVLRYGEQLRPDGTVDNRGDPGITPGDIQTDTYILRGDPAGETWSPQFSLKSFAYVQVDGFPGKPSLSSVQMEVVHTDLKSAGSFHCSDPLLNAIQAMVLRSMLSNFQSIPTDTPMYEKRGWLGDAQVMAATALQNLELDRFYRSRLQGIVDDQRANGSVALLSPAMHDYPGVYHDNGWSSALIVIAFQVYENDGDTQILTDFYPAMAKYVNYISGLTVNGTLSGQYGDWLPPTGPMGADVDLVETAYLYHDQKRLAEIARVAGHPEDVAHWNDLAGKTFASFNKAFLNRDRAMYFNRAATVHFNRAGITDYLLGLVGRQPYHQTANALPLAFGLVPPELRQRVADQLAADVVAKGNHLSTGMMGTKELLPVLSSTGHADLALALARQTTPPSWGYMLEKTQGRTGIWESWGPQGVRSFDHMMFGTIGDWFYKYLGGIRPLEPGFASVAIDPDLSPGLDAVDAMRITPYGTLSVSWKRQAGVLNLNVTVPVNSTAEVWVPAEREDQVKEGGRTLLGSPGVSFLRKDNGRLVYRIGSGTYSLTVAT